MSEVLLSVTRVRNGFEYHVPVFAMGFSLAADPANRNRLADELLRLSRACREGKQPFYAVTGADPAAVEPSRTEEE